MEQFADQTHTSPHFQRPIKIQADSPQTHSKLDLIPVNPQDELSKDISLAFGSLSYSQRYFMDTDSSRKTPEAIHTANGGAPSMT